MHELKEMLCQRLKDYGRKGSLTSSDLEQVHLLTDTVKNIGKIEMQKGYSERGSYGYDYDNSYKRDSMGRYSRSYGDDMSERIEHMMHDPNTTARDKDALRRAMDLLR